MGITIFWSEWDGKSGSHDLLRRAVGEFLHCRPEALVFGQGEHGRPELAGREDVDFSISHSEKLWACAVGSCRVGLDLQKEYEKNGEKLARRFFHPQEIAWMEEHGFGHFSRIWTQRSTVYVKYTGTGLSSGLDYFLGDTGTAGGGE